MGINWQYFFGVGKIGHKRRYYKSEINGIRVEKSQSVRITEYSIGNMDEAKEKYKTEEELIEAVKQNQNEPPQRL